MDSFRSLKMFADENNRIEGMPAATQDEVAALYKLVTVSDVLVIDDLIEYVKVIQPNAVLRNKPGLNVRVGHYYPPVGGPEVESRLDDILSGASNLMISSYEIHLQYEELHPFTDGNGRSGRAVWLWMRAGVAPLGFLHQFYYQCLESNTTV